MYPEKSSGHDVNPLTRKPVEHPDKDPLWRNVGRLTYFKGKETLEEYHATGTLIYTDGGIGILTCAHAMWDQYSNAIVRKATFAPAYEAGGGPPFAPIEFTSDRILIAPAFKDHSTSLAHDWAAVQVPAYLLPDGLNPHTMPQLLAQRDHSIEPETLVRITGYPAPSEQMEYSEGKVNYALHGAIVYDIDSDHGFSGSAVVRADSLNRIIGVHKAVVEGQERGGALITPKVAEAIKKWLKEA